MGWVVLNPVASIELVGVEIAGTGSECATSVATRDAVSAHASPTAAAGSGRTVHTGVVYSADGEGGIEMMGISGSEGDGKTLRISSGATFQANPVAMSALRASEDGESYGLSITPTAAEAQFTKPPVIDTTSVEVHVSGATGACACACFFLLFSLSLSLSPKPRFKLLHYTLKFGRSFFLVRPCQDLEFSFLSEGFLTPLVLPSCHHNIH